MVSPTSGGSGLGPLDWGTTSVSDRAKQMIKKLDTNGDGKISLSELQAGAPKDGKGKDAASIMKETDTNNDGEIDESELEASMTKMDAKMKAMGPPPGPPPSGGAQKSQSSSGQTNSTDSSSSSSSDNKIYDPRDTNKDGKVSFMEELTYDLKHPEDAKKTSSSNNQDQIAQAYDESGNKNGGSVGENLNTVV